MDVYSFSLLNDIAEPSVIVDHNATVIWRSDSASELFQEDSFAASETIANLFKCIHADFLPAPCSSAPFCQHCVARRIVDLCLHEEKAVAQPVSLSINADVPFTVEATMVAKPIGDEVCKLAIVTLLNARTILIHNILHRYRPDCESEGSQHWLHLEDHLRGACTPMPEHEQQNGIPRMTLI